MKYLLLSIGTRGDMEPFLAVGELLAARGHEVVCAMPEQFGELVANTALGFRPLDRRFLELIEGETGRAFMGQRGNWFKRLRLLWKVGRSSLGIQRNLLQQQRDYLQVYSPDRVLYHPKCLYGRHWGMAHPERAFVVSPIPNWLHPVREYPHIAFSGRYSERVNLWTYRLINYFTALAAAKWSKAYRADFPGLRFSRKTVSRHMREQEQCLYLVAPQLFARPAYWPENAWVLGYYERQKTRDWTPGSDLLAFLERYATQPKLFVTFGSMINADPEGTTREIIKVLDQHQIPTILNVSSGGLVKLAAVPEHVLFVNNIPYEWIFPQMQAVMHHGGSGTTHTAVKHACANLIIPHIVDQFFWNRRIADLGLGPKGIKIKHLSAERLTPLLLDVVGNLAYTTKAKEVAKAMGDGHTSTELLQLLEK